jgi:hypothetical protein
MWRIVGILMCLGVTACRGRGEPEDASHVLALADAGPPRDSSCATDVDCPTGMLCEGCGDGFMTCVPGCRTDAQCGANMLCNHDVQCLTCPCPSGYCDLDPCRDLDGDGYAAALTGICPGKSIGDCNDGARTTNPAARERCANGRDDDCDGRSDSRDVDGVCRTTCDPGFGLCSTSIYCGTQRYCDRGCCELCAAPVDPVCAPGQCLLAGGLDGNGCLRPGVCGDCQSCSLDQEPVCGRNFATYTNACRAEAAGTQVLHTGECLRGEGVTCEDKSDCYSNQFCRDLGDAGQHCSKVGTCSVDADCDHVTSVVSCGDAGLASWTCRNERCSPVCP